MRHRWTAIEVVAFLIWLGIVGGLLLAGAIWIAGTLTQRQVW